MRPALDRIRLQLVLGGTDSRDAVERLKQEFGDRVNELNQALDGRHLREVDMRKVRCVDLSCQGR